LVAGLAHEEKHFSIVIGRIHQVRRSVTVYLAEMEQDLKVPAQHRLGLRRPVGMAE
jgi:hypothetical protein